MRSQVFEKRWEQTYCLPSLHIGAIVLLLVAFKLYALEMVSRDFLQCSWCLSPTALIHEISFCLVVLLLHLASNVVSQALLRHAIRWVVLMLIALMAADLAVSYQFWTRLTLADLIKHLPEAGSILSFARSTHHPPQVWALALAAVTTIVAISYRYLCAVPTSQLPSGLMLWVCLCVYGCTALEREESLDFREYHERFTQNVLEIFFAPALEKVAYSDQFAVAVPPLGIDEQRCVRGQHNRVNIILVVVESLSVFHSQLFSGINDWTPELDSLTQKGMRFSDFYANGVTTEQGLIALLTGQPPIERGIETASTLFAQYQTPIRSLPRDLHRAGYETSFLTTGNLGFLGKRDWLHALGFDRVEGHDAPAYDGLARYSFDAADDRALYGRTLELVERQKSPFFFAVETVTTHLPYVDPETGEHSAERVYRYADRVLGEFARALEKQGYFENGVLIVTGDHRAMVPMTTAERERFGDYGYARVPLLVMGHGIKPGVSVKTRFSHTDLLPSLIHLATNQSQCLSANQGILLPSAQLQPRCSFTRRSYNTGQLYARCDGGDVTVQLAGDQTRLTADHKNSSLLNAVHRLRLGRGF